MIKPFKHSSSGTGSGASSPTLPNLSWPISLPNPIPHRYRRRIRSKLRSRQSPASSVSALETSLSPLVTLQRLRRRRWNRYDLQYVLLAALWTFSMAIGEAPAPLLKVGMVTLLGAALVVPVTGQFFLPFLPIITWLVFFFNCRFIPAEYRPPIWVRVLPALENIFYGANLSNLLSAHQNVVLDVLAWLPYGIIHFGAPLVCSGLLWLFGPPGTTPVFARSFGYMNIVGVTIQILFPCAPPWYENLFGLAPADYSMAGSPAGLARIDALFGVDLYTSSFTASPMVFGAFPSLHSGSAVLEALFMAHCFPRLRPLLAAYVLWLWWATMYLSHHYAVDLVGGALIAAAVFGVARARFLPRVQADKALRWDYDFVEVGAADDSDSDGPAGRQRDGASAGGAYAMAPYGHRRGDSSDGWTVGSSSSYSSESSPIESHSLWEGETLASQSSDHEFTDVRLGK